MASQQIRNLINNQIDSVIARAETTVRNESKKKLTDIKQKIPTPKDIIKKLQANPNINSCSDQGINKFYKIHENINGKLNTLKNILIKGIDTLTEISEKIDPILNEKGPIGKINTLIDTLQPLLDVLKIIISAAPVLLAANSGPTSSGAVTDQISTRRNKAESKVKVVIGATIN